MSVLLVPGGRVSLPKHELLHVVLGWDAACPVSLSKFCVSIEDGRIVDVLSDSKPATKDRVVCIEDDYMVDLQAGTNLTYVFGLYTTERMEEIDKLLFTVVNEQRKLVAYYDRAARFGFSSVVMGAISYHNDWRVRAVGVGSFATSIIDILPTIKAAL